MYKGYFIAFWVLFYIFRLFLEKRKDNGGMLLVSFFLTAIPLQFNIPIGEPVADSMTGTLGSQMYIYLPMILFIAFLPFYNFRLLKDRLLSGNRWVYFILFFLGVSLINTNNVQRSGTVIATVFFISNLLLFFLINSNLHKKTVLKGVYDGFFVMGVLNLLLAICFPVLGMKFITTLIHATGEEGATRLNSESREGAIGLFTHPGNLALFTTITSVFFLYFVVTKNKLRQTYLILAINLITLILTFSRTAYLVYLVNMGLVYYILTHPKKILFSAKNTIRYALPLILVVSVVFFFSSFNTALNGSDLSDQFDNRALHWMMGLIAFQQSPLMGVGLNAHLSFFAEHLSLTSLMQLDDFFTANPIHNIHLIVLSELGLPGLVCWIVFLFSGLNKARNDIAAGKNVVMSAAQMGIIVSFIMYGLSGWAPFSLSILPYFLFITYFANSYRKRS